nr:ASPIC/UnbV domain-containing protein [Actinomycetota bacterium]
ARGYGDAAGILRPGTLRLNGRGLAAADAGNDGRTVVAVNTIGGNIALLRPQGPSGHWLDVALSRFSPGAVVTVALPDGRQLTRTVQAGSSYLSSEDPRLHFGLGTATAARRVSVRLPSGRELHLTNVSADRIVTVAVPAAAAPAPAAAVSYRTSGCTSTPSHESVATLWDETATEVLRLGEASEPVQARDLLALARAMTAAYAATAGDPSGARETAVSFAAYRLLVWRASLGTNLSAAFTLLGNRLRSLCLSPSFTSVTGDAVAAIGNRAAASEIAAGARDGSHEALHYADTSYAPVNAPLVVARQVSTVHDPTFWQPLAVEQQPPVGVTSVPATVQTFVDSQWGQVRTFAPGTARVRVPERPLDDPASAAYKAAALAVIRATAGGRAARIDTSPAGWNDVARARASGDLAADLRLYRLLNGALNDAAILAWRVKRADQAPRPISVIRFLAFQGHSPGGLPLVAGLSRLRGSEVQVRLHGRWIRGDSWVPPLETPASPGGAAESAAFGYAANTVLTALTGRSSTSRAAAAANAALAGGIDFPADLAVGRRIGVAVARLALAKR